jgi:2-polyprenyl-3-methyl-5-hydroxy-6-metoxy-1,4-benzoquinol methylase
MTIVEPAGLAEFKQRSRTTWAAGDFPAVARRTLWEVGQRLVSRVGIGAGEDVLDVACGTGNVAIRAAQAGGRVLEASGRWADLRQELADVYDRREPGEYLIVLGRKAWHRRHGAIR